MTTTSSLEQDLSQLAIWDRSQLLSRVGNRQDRIELLIEMYLDDAHNQLTKLKKAILALDYPIVAATSHRIKGSAANLGAEKVRALCHHLEEAAQNGDSDSIEFFWPLFKTAHQEFEQELKSAE